MEYHSSLFPYLSLYKVPTTGLLASTVTPLQAVPPGVLQQVGYYVRGKREKKREKEKKD
jgi:hypothetical protein